MEHLAVIMDGNGRWAEKRHLPRLMGHRAGAEALDRRFLHLIEAAGFTAQHEWDERGFLAFLEKAGLEVLEHRSFAARQPLCVAICRIGADCDLG